MPPGDRAPRELSCQSGQQPAAFRPGKRLEVFAQFFQPGNKLRFPFCDGKPRTLKTQLQAVAQLLASLVEHPTRLVKLLFNDQKIGQSTPYRDAPGKP